MATSAKSPMMFHAILSMTNPKNLDAPAPLVVFLAQAKTPKKKQKENCSAATRRSMFDSESPSSSMLVPILVDPKNIESVSAALVLQHLLRLGGEHALVVFGALVVGAVEILDFGEWKWRF